MSLPSALKDMAQRHISDQLSNVMETQMSAAFTPTSTLLTLQHVKCTPAGLPFKTPGKGGLGYSSLDNSVYLACTPESHEWGAVAYL